MRSFLEREQRKEELLCLFDWIMVGLLEYSMEGEYIRTSPPRANNETNNVNHR